MAWYTNYKYIQKNNNEKNIKRIVPEILNNICWMKGQIKIDRSVGSVYLISDRQKTPKYEFEIDVFE